MIKKVLEYQRRLGLIEDGDRIIAGFSGGADSVCLLFVLEELKKYWDIAYCAVHVEHGIRGEESLGDAAFAEKFCQERGIPFIVYHVDAPEVARQERLSLEEAARKLRYECFEKARIEWDANKIAVAHHADDNAETMLFHMVRGTGLKGMGGILPKRDGIIRPLLCLTRQEIEGYLTERQVGYCTDSTNSQIQYSRNRIRLNVIPQMEALNERAVEHMSVLSGQLTEIYEYIAKEAWYAGREAVKVICLDDSGTITEILSCGDETSAAEFLAPKKKFLDAVCTNWCIEKEKIITLHPVLRREFLYQVLGMAAGSYKDIGTVHVENLCQLFSAETGKQTNLPYGLVGVARYQDVCLKKDDANKKTTAKNDEASGCSAEAAIEIDLAKAVEEELVIELGNWQRIYVKTMDFDGDCEKIPEKTYTKWFDYDKIKSTVFLRKRQPGDYLVINRQGNQKKLKEYFIHEKVPKEARDETWLLAEDSHIIWAIGYRISESYKITTQTKRILEVRVEKENENGRDNSRNVY